MQTTHNDTMWTPYRVATGLSVLAGLWVLVSPFILGYSDQSMADENSALWNDVVLGIAVAVLGAIMFFTSARYGWVGWISAILGLWLLISPWVLNFSDNNSALWNNVVFGVVAIVLGGWSAMTAGNRSMA
jgi:hypothetical protein